MSFPDVLVARQVEQMILTYRVTPEDVIEFVNDAWVRFAVENDAFALAKGSSAHHSGITSQARK